MLSKDGGKENMLRNEIVMEADICRDILNGLIAGYSRYGRTNGIDLKDKKTNFSKMYCQIVTENRKTRFYKTEAEIINCNKLIAVAKAELKNVGINNG